MRAFISLGLPSKIKKEVAEIQQNLKTTGIQARWVKPEIVHLTLTFLGSITPHKINLISNLLEEVSHQMSLIKLKLHQLSCFPYPAKAKIIFIELGGELVKIDNLALKIRKKLKKEKIWFDTKPFAAHVTLGRVKKQLNLTKIIKKIKIKKTEFVANKVVLMKSQLTDSGPIYHPIKTISRVKQSVATKR